MDLFDFIFHRKQGEKTREQKSAGGVILPWEQEEIVKALGKGRGDRKYTKQHAPALGSAEARKVRRERNKAKRVSRLLHRKRLAHGRQVPRAQSRRKVNV